MTLALALVLWWRRYTRRSGDVFRERRSYPSLKFTGFTSGGIYHSIPFNSTNLGYTKVVVVSEHLMKVDNNQITAPTIGQCTGGTPTYTDSNGTHPRVYSGSAGAHFPIQ
jgi:hypothetical protein